MTPSAEPAVPRWFQALKRGWRSLWAPKCHARTVELFASVALGSCNGENRSLTPCCGNSDIIDPTIEEKKGENAMPEQMDLPFGTEVLMKEPATDGLKEVTIKRHTHGYAVIVPNSVEVLVFPHLGTALAEAKRLLHG